MYLYIYIFIYLHIYIFIYLCVFIFIGFKPLVILHCRHLAPGIVPHDQQSIVDAWEAEGKLYQTPQVSLCHSIAYHIIFYSILFRSTSLFII